MKRKKMMFGIVFVLGIIQSSCSKVTDFEYQDESKQGTLALKLGANANFAGTRAVDESVFGNVDNYTVVVTDKDGAEKMNCKGYEIASKMPLTLNIGSYSIKAYYGTEHPASRNGFYVYGELQGTIKANQKEEAQVVCTPTCGRIKVEFDANMANYYSDYNVTFTGTEALGSETISWLKSDTEPWYVLLKEGGEDVSFTITTISKDEYINNQQQGATKTGTFKLYRNKGYKMKISANYTPTAVGDIQINITIDESTNDIPVDIEVPIEWI